MTTATFRTVRRLFALAVLASCKTGGAPAAAAPSGTTVTATGAITVPSASNISGQLAPGTTPRMVAVGDSIYHAGSCRDCHGPNAKGTPHGPDLTAGKFVQIDGSYAQIVNIITTGVPENRILDMSFPEPMPPRGGDKPALTDDQIRSLAAYVYTLSHH